MRENKDQPVFRLCLFMGILPGLGRPDKALVQQIQQRVKVYGMPVRARLQKSAHSESLIVSRCVHLRKAELDKL